MRVLFYRPRNLSALLVPADCVVFLVISEFEGRTIEVNGEVVTPGQVPLPQSVGGVYYFHFGSGTKSWASWSVW